MSDKTYNPYSISDIAGGGGYILLRNGAEIGTAESLLAAALKAADDAISGYPEVTLDIMHDPLDGQILGNVIGMSWYREALADEIVANWDIAPEATEVVQPTSPASRV
jgi:hypothetical protein